MVTVHPAVHRIGIVLLVAVLVVLLYWCTRRTELPPMLTSDCVEIPDGGLDVPTAGLSGLKLVVETKCVFQIDLANSDRLYWGPFKKDYRTAQVKMRVTIDSTGKVVDVYCQKDGGLPKALQHVEASVWGWEFDGGCLHGDIYFEFNAAGSFLHYDDSHLDTVEAYRYCDIERKRLHAIWKTSDFSEGRTQLVWRCRQQ